jgi:hypothetical protein
MEVVMSGISPVPARRRTLENWAGLGGVVYVLLFVGGSILSYSGQPDTGDPPGKLISYYSDSGHRDKIAFGWLIALVGVFFFLWFVAGLRQYMRRIDGDGLMTSVATIGGAVYAALTLAGRSVDFGIKTMSDDTFRDQVYPELIHAADDAGYVLHAVGWVSVVFGVLAVFSVFFIPLFLNAIWLLVAGVLLFLAQPEPVVAP